MTIQEFRDYMASGKPVIGGSDVHMMFHQLSQEALQITAEINGKYHSPEPPHSLSMPATRSIRSSVSSRTSVATIV